MTSNTDFLTELFQVIETRKNASADSSYTASLLQKGEEKCAQKFGEEAFEFAMAMVSENKENVKNEAADVIYHLFVALSAKGIHWGEVVNILKARTAQSGHEEKASRS